MGAKIIAWLCLATIVLAACDNRQSGGVPRADASSLIRFAQDAFPITRGLEACRKVHGSYPPDADSTIGCLPRTASVARQAHFLVVGDWLISPDSSGVGYTLMRHLDGRAVLVRRCAGRICRWIYDPGDGRPSVEMKFAGAGETGGK
jgi:hypothetical protein